MCLHNMQLMWKLGIEEFQTSCKEEISFLSGYSTTHGQWENILEIKSTAAFHQSCAAGRRGEVAGETGGRGSSLINWTTPHQKFPHTHSSAVLTTGCFKAHCVSRDHAEITFTSCSCLISYSACLPSV